MGESTRPLGNPVDSYRGDAPELLFHIAAVLYTSALGPVAEAFGVHENNYSVVSEVTVDGAGDILAGLEPLTSGSVAPHTLLVTADATAHGVPSQLLAPSSAGRVALSQLSHLAGAPLLVQLGLLPASTLSGYVTTHPAVIAELLAHPPAATAVSVWWTGLDNAAQQTLASNAPQLVGNLDGVPAETRDRANRLWLQNSITTLEATTVDTANLSTVAGALHTAHMLHEVETALGTDQSVPARSLLTVDSVGQGTAAVVLGDLATADYVTYLVPGMFFTVDGQIADWTDDAARLYDEQVSWLAVLGAKDPGYATKSVAVVAWMGYQTPNLTNIATLDLAETGADALADVIRGLRTERAGNEPSIAVIGHSYGSTTALIAVTEYSLGIDALALVGSPGSAAQSVDELNVRDHNVFVGEAAWDPVPHTAYFGSDPGAEDYGAKQINVGGGVDLITGESLSASLGHNGYFDLGSESVRNLALIGIGQGELVTDGSTDDQDKTLALVK